jgi:hypothetical protein
VAVLVLVLMILTVVIQSASLVSLGEATVAQPGRTGRGLVYHGAVVTTRREQEGHDRPLPPRPR